MNGSDLCKQSWNKYNLSNHAHLRSWWPLFWHLISASISNVLYLYRLKGINESELTHLQLQERLGLQLLRNPAAVSRKVDMTSIALTNRPSLVRRPLYEHRWTRVPKRRCVVCTPPAKRGRPRGWRGLRRREALQELEVNIVQARPARQAVKRSTWGCYECEVALCKDSFCWQRHHGEDI